MPRTVVLCALALLLAGAAASLAATSTDQNPVVSFGTYGPHEVQLTVCNGSSCTTVSHVVEVLNPNPVASVPSVVPLTVPQGATISLSGTGTGKPPLAYRWDVVDAQNATLATLLGPTADWTALDPPGTYTVLFQVSNDLATSPPVSTVVTVEASSFIFGDGFELELSRWTGPPPP